MKKFIVLLTLLCVFSQAVTLGAYNVFAYESAACGNCEYFNYRDVADLLKFKDYKKILNLNLNPMVHTLRSKINGVWVYTHRFDSTGSAFITKVRFQVCANNLYPDRTLEWANRITYERESLFDVARKFFTEDNGASIINCVNTATVHTPYLDTAFDQYLKAKLSGVLPLIGYVNENGKLISGLFNLNKRTLRVNVCLARSDKQQQTACSDVKSGLNFLEEDRMSIVTEEDLAELNATSDSFDYEKFWNTPEDN